MTTRTITAIDLFAGAGGFTAGAELAGARVLFAANHWAPAVAIHQANHPSVEHMTQDLHQVDWRLTPDHDILLASPACQGHSQAGQPGRWRPGVLARQDMDRNTAWAVISCAEIKRPATILVENVEKFLAWPLLPAWEHALGILGYQVRRHVFDAAEFGVPQHRRRAIITARLGEALELRSPKLDPVAFGPCIQWDAGRWVPISSRPEGVRRRVDLARARGLGDRYLVHYDSYHRGRELSRPIGCITTKNQWAVVQGDDIRMLTLTEYRRAMSFADNYALPETRHLAVRMLGNAIPPLFAANIIQQAMA